MQASYLWKKLFTKKHLIEHYEEKVKGLPVRNEFERALEQMLTIRYDLFGVKFYLRNLQMMIYYELNDHNSFLLLLDSYRHFLNNNRSVTEDWKKTQTVLIKFLTRLFNLKENYDEYELKKLKQDVSSSLVLKKQWLLRKIEELESVCK